MFLPLACCCWKLSVGVEPWTTQGKPSPFGYMPHFSSHAYGKPPNRFLRDMFSNLFSGRMGGENFHVFFLQAKPLLKKNNIRELVDPSLGDNYNSLQMKLMVLTAFLCTQQSSIQRPQMRQARSPDLN